MTAKQGHKYEFHGFDVLCMETQDKGAVKVSRIDHGQPYPLGVSFYADVDQLKPLPMKYFGNEVPA